MGFDIFNVFGLPSPNDFWAANQSRENATTAYNRQREMAQWLGTNQVQWRMQDMKAAGLNPILAAQGGFGGFAGAPGVPNAGSVSAGQGKSLGDAKMLMSQLEVNSAQAENLRADASKKRAETPDHDQFGRKYEADIRLTGASADAASGAADVARATVSNLEADTKNLDKRTEELKTKIAQEKLDLDTARAIQESVIQFERYKAANMKYTSQLTNFEGQLAGKAAKTLSAFGDPKFYEEAFGGITSGLNSVAEALSAIGQKVLSMGDAGKKIVGESLWNYFSQSRRSMGLITLDSPERKEFGANK